jgi:hypothetical protein
LRNSSFRVEQFLSDLRPFPLIFIIENNVDKLTNYCWEFLCRNENALPLIEKILDKLTEHGWFYLCKNKNAIPLIEKNLDKLTEDCLINLCKNSNIFIVIKYKIIKEKMDIIREDLIKNTLHPRKLNYYLTKYNYDILSDEYIEND